MRNRTIMLAAGSLLAAGFLATAAQAAPITYLVTANTSTVSGQAGFIDLQFNPGVASQGATASISNFATDGTLNAASVQLTGGAAGLLPGLVTLQNSGALNDYFEGIAFGVSISFDLTLNGPALSAPNGTATSGSTFALSFFDASAVTALLTTDPNGFAGLVDVNLDGSTTPTTFPATANGDPAVTFVVASVPEPSTLLLLAGGLLGAAAWRRKAA